MIQYLALEEILRLHFQIIEDYGGSHGVRDEGRIESVVYAPQQVAFGIEQYPDVLTIAGVYLRNIIADHPFVDGNKRTAVTVCGVFLQRNGFELTAKPHQLEDFVVEVTVQHHSIVAIAAWIKAHTQNT